MLVAVVAGYCSLDTIVDIRAVGLARLVVGLYAERILVRM